MPHISTVQLSGNSGRETLRSSRTSRIFIHMSLLIEVYLRHDFLNGAMDGNRGYRNFHGRFCPTMLPIPDVTCTKPNHRFEVWSFIGFIACLTGAFFQTLLSYCVRSNPLGVLTYRLTARRVVLVRM
ncbi:hypothetical protein OG21DRAFT_1316026 [Imleria badia]|nr:hypothetical protein OG21DRAFT_1316026 [Imleria badia]